VQRTDLAGDLLYLDTSALVKLVRLEAETEALLQFLAAEEELVTSLLTNIEVHRAVRRASSEPAQDAERIRVLLASINILPIDEMALSAARVQPSTLRTLDAIHLASALSLGEQLGGMVAYDCRLTDAAQGYGITVYAPV
jgi:predicted nucleic acid-binding protein